MPYRLFEGLFERVWIRYRFIPGIQLPSETEKVRFYFALGDSSDRGNQERYVGV